MAGRTDDDESFDLLDQRLMDNQQQMRFGGTLQTESTIEVKRPLKDYSSILKEI